jgi:integrase
MPPATGKWRRRVGRVTVYRRGQRYWIYYRQGRQVRRPVGTSREAALAQAARINAQLAEGAPTEVAFQPIAIEQLIVRWLEHHEHVRRSSLATVQRYRTAVGHLLDFVKTRRDSIRADRFSLEMAEKFVRYLRTTRVSPNGHANTKRRLMRDKGVVFVLGTCRALFNFARQHRHLPAYATNPFSGMRIERMPIEDAKPIHPLTPDQELAFFRACDEWQFPLFLVLAFTGLRVGELTHLLIDSDVDLAANVIRVTNKPCLGWQIKTRNLRQVPLLPEIARTIREVIGERTSGPVFLRRRFHGDGVQPALSGYSVRDLERELSSRADAAEGTAEGPTTRADTARLTRDVWRDAGAVKETTIRLEFMAVTARIGLNHLTSPKDLRHLFATSLQAAGVDPMVRRDVMGHTSLDMTAHYTHTQQGTAQREIARLAGLRGRVLRLVPGSQCA